MSDGNARTLAALEPFNDIIGFAQTQVEEGIPVSVLIDGHPHLLPVRKMLHDPMGGTVTLTLAGTPKLDWHVPVSCVRAVITPSEE